MKKSLHAIQDGTCDKRIYIRAPDERIGKCTLTMDTIAYGHQQHWASRESPFGRLH